MFRYTFSAIFTVVLFFSCGDSSEPDSSLPTNLNVSINNVDDGSGLVEVTASATNAVDFTMDTGVSGIDLLSDASGQFSYTYENTGTYLIKITAIGPDGATAEAEESIVVNSGAPAVVGVGYSTPIEYFGKTLIWNEEFNGNTLNEEFWSYDIGDGCPNLCGWGNQELQYYRSENVEIGGGVLTIEAKRESFQNNSYTSGKIVTRKKQLFQFGRIDVRAQMPATQGFWPAIWMLGDNQDEVGWPSCGEIDIVEVLGGSTRAKEALGTAFWQDNGIANFTGKYELANGTFADEYHVFSITWDESAIRWYVDDNLYHTLSITSAPLSELTLPFYLNINLAVGGTLPGSPDATTIFPSDVKIDYVRYFQDN
jgi:hypothetical protein